MVDLSTKDTTTKRPTWLYRGSTGKPSGPSRKEKGMRKAKKSSTRQQLCVPQHKGYKHEKANIVDARTKQ